MGWYYTFDPRVWPALITLALVLFLGEYSWRRRKVPGATFFAVACLFAALWALGTVMQISAQDFSTKVFWVKFENIWPLPAATAILGFVFAYAGLGRWLSRRNLVILSIPPLLFLALIITNAYHHLAWTGFQLNEYVIPSPGAADWAVLAYIFILALLSMIVLLRLAVRSPWHRWPVAIMLSGQIIGRGLFLLNIISADALGPGESVLVTVGLVFSMYALAFFRFHVLNPVPLARSAIIEQMSDGMLVLDLEGKIVDLNPVAEKISGQTGDELRGRRATEVLPLKPESWGLEDKARAKNFEINLGNGTAARHYNLNLTWLTDRQGQALGQLLLLHDMTEQKRAQDQILEQRQVMATLRERERLARELHDSIGQVLGYISMQVQTIRKLTREGKTEQAEPEFSELLKVARDTQADVRESILNLKTRADGEWSFVPALKQYLSDFQVHHGIRTELQLPDELKENTFEPATGVQILRVIQEALTNARKHSQARAVKVGIELKGYRASITISDDGTGFQTSPGNQGNGQHFGLAFMRERMEQIGGALIIDSRPGEGTAVKLETPIWSQKEKMP